MALTDLLDKRGGVIVLDGGMGTGLTRLGLTGRQAWTAGSNTEDPQIRHAVKSVHLDFLRAGVDVITANSYNVSKAREIKVAHRDGSTMSPETAAERENRFIRMNVALARDAIESFVTEEAGRFDGLLAASMGCFGSLL